MQKLILKIEKSLIFPQKLILLEFWVPQKLSGNLLTLNFLLFLTEYTNTQIKIPFRIKHIVNTNIF